jgi:thiosulfate reductase cytochrome b subunit
MTSKDIIFNSFQNLSKFRHVNYVCKHANSNVKNVSLTSPLLFTYSSNLLLTPTAEMSAKIASRVCMHRMCLFKLFIQFLYYYLSELQTMYDSHAQHRLSSWYTKIYEFSYTTGLQS